MIRIQIQTFLEKLGKMKFAILVTVILHITSRICD